jgi:hypothetical protein
VQKAGYSFLGVDIMRSPLLWKISTALLATLCIVLAYHVLDGGIWLTYLRASAESTERQAALITGLVEKEWIGRSEADVTSRLQAYVDSKPEEKIVLKREAEENVLYLEGTAFRFREGKLVKVD